MAMASRLVAATMRVRDDFWRVSAFAEFNGRDSREPEAIGSSFRVGETRRSRATTHDEKENSAEARPLLGLVFVRSF
jgi:hypothetical protein